MKISKLRPFQAVRPLTAVIPFLIILIVASQRPSQAQGQHRTYLPIVHRPPINCNTAAANYDSLYVIPPPFGGDPATHIEFNLGYRGYKQVSEARKLVKLGPVWDPNAPQFNTIFTDNRMPTFSNTYQRYRWVNGEPVDIQSSWDVTVLGLATTPGEILRIPDSGYDVGGRNDVLVLYADPERLTLKYTLEDSVAYGYTVYMEGICVDTDLLNLYNALHAAGRKKLPAVPGGKPLGVALGSEIKVAVRDAGHFLDPRSCNDWWIAYNQGC